MRSHQVSRSWGGVVEETFAVFCGVDNRLDREGFIEFCRECQLVNKMKLSSVDMNSVFNLAVVGDAQSLDLQEFRVALGLLVNMPGVSAAAGA